MRKAVLYITWIVFAVGLQSCTKEDLEDCFFGLRLNVNYAFEDATSSLPADIRCVRAYIFDESNVLCDIAKAEGTESSHSHTMDIPLKPGKYKIIVWGSNNQDFFHSYGEGVKTSTLASPYNDGVAIGKTTLSDLCVYLKGVSSSNGSEIEFKPTASNFDDLYYGAVGKRTQGTSQYILKEVTITDYDIAEETASLIRNTHQLYVTITGLENLIRKTDDQSFEDVADIYVIGKGRIYSWDNAFVSSDDHTKFTPYQIKENSDGSITYNIKHQRALWEEYLDWPLLFYIFDKEKNEEVFDFDVMASLLGIHDEQGDYINENQEDLDRAYSHDIEIDIARKSGGDLIVKIIIDGWKVVNIHPATNK